MMVQASEEVGKDSDHPTDSNQILIVDQPSTSSKPKKKQKSRRKQSCEDRMQLTDLMVLCTKLQKHILDLEKAMSDQAIEIASLKKRVKKLEMKRKSRITKLKRLRKVGAARRVESSEDKDSLGDQEDPSKLGRNIADIDQDVNVTLIDETQGKLNDEDMFGLNDLHGEEVIVEDIVAPTIPVTTAKEEQVYVSKPTVSSTQSSIKDKGKAIMIEPERPLKKKDQVAADEELARQLDAEMQAEIAEEERIRRQKEEEANIALIESWENTQAMMEADRLLAERLQTREREELTDEEKAKLFVELIKKRRKHFAALRAQEKRNRPPTKAQKRSQMITYLKNMGGYKHSHLKGKTYEEIQKLFDVEMKRVNLFIPMDSDVESSKKDRTDKEQESNSKRASDDLESDVSKKQKVDEQVETEKDDDLKKEEMKKHMEIVRDDDIAIDAIPLASKPPVIVEYKIIKEGIIGHFHLIRADGSSKRYSSMIKMLQGIDREDLQTLWKLVKAKHDDTRPEDEYERVLWGDLKVMFEPDRKSESKVTTASIKLVLLVLTTACAQLVLLVIKIQLLSDYNCWKDYADRDKIKDISEKR
ncbi:hypothetical protein Tco_0883842 [Tanacetum coccineum]